MTAGSTDHVKAVLEASLGDAYRLECELGGGGMSRVFLAEEIALGRKVVIKVLPPELTSAVNSDRFKREVLLSARLHHPHIVPVLAAGVAGDLAFYTMPYVNGESLRHRLEREGALPIAEALSILRDMAEALAYAHRLGIVHRDIKPDNVLVAERHALIADFGVAKAIASSARESNLTVVGVSVGTPAYMAPEQAAADPAVDHRADIYAFGVVAYEILTGRAAFSAGTSQQILAAQIHHTPESIERYRPAVPPWLVRVAMRCLEKHPADRYQSASEVLADLDVFTSAAWATTTTAAHPILTPPPPSARRSGRALRWAGAVTALAVTIGLAAWGVTRPPASVPASESGEFLDSVAVLPLRYVGQDADTAGVSDAIAEHMVSHLTQIRRLKVISRMSAAAVTRERNLTLPQVAALLKVRHVVDGVTKRVGDSLFVTVKLIDAVTDAHLWTNEFAFAAEDLKNQQQAISTVLAHRLVAAAPRLRGSPLTQTAAAHPAAYQAFLRGRSEMYPRTADGLRRAVSAFEEAIAIDSSFPSAHAALASALALCIRYGYDLPLPAYDAAARAFESADRAIQLDSNSADGYAARGFLASVVVGPIGQIRTDFERASQLRPNSPESPGWIAHLLAREGKHDEGLAQAQRGIDLDPQGPARRIGFAHDALHAHRYDQALREARRAEDLEPTLAFARVLQVYAMVLSANAADCLAVDVGAYAGTRALCLYAVGRAADAAAIARSATALFGQQRTPTDGISRAALAQDMAVYTAWTGDKLTSALWLRRAFELSPVGVDLRTENSGLFGKVLTDPNYANELRRLRGTVWGRIQSRRAPARGQDVTATS